MNNFIPKRHIVSSQQLLKATPEEVFPLLCPKREYEWIPTWDCEIIYSKSGFAELDCIFITNFNNWKETWVVDKYEKNKEIQFIIFSENRIIRYSISLTDNNNETTAAVWEQTITSLNEDGNLYLENYDNNNFSTRIKTLETLLNHFLQTGEMLKT